MVWFLYDLLEGGKNSGAVLKMSRGTRMLSVETSTSKKYVEIILKTVKAFPVAASGLK